MIEPISELTKPYVCQQLCPQLLFTRSVREALLASRTAPPPAGNEAAVSPSPLVHAQRADPRSTMEALPPQDGAERTDGRTATHREHGAGAAGRTGLPVRTTIPP